LEPDNPLWRYALAVWKNPDVQRTCLGLQDEGWSVTRLILAGWLAQQNRRYTGTEDATVSEWRDRVTGTLRAVRRTLPKAPETVGGLRQSIAGLELQAEQLELALVWRTQARINQTEADMHGRETLIKTNLVAAAPCTQQANEVSDILNALARSLANLSEGDYQP